MPCSGVPPLRVGRFPVFLPWRLLCLLSFLAFSCPSGFFLLSVGVVVLFVLFGSLVVVACVSTAAGVSLLSFRFGVLGLLFVTSSGVSFLPPCPRCLRVAGVFFFLAVLVASRSSLPRGLLGCRVVWFPLGAFALSCCVGGFSWLEIGKSPM